MPFWLGEAPGRSRELSLAVSRLRREVADRLAADPAAVRAWLADELGLGAVAAEQIADYLAAAEAALGTMPTQETLVLERFFDEAGDQHLVIHAPFGSRLNRAWGLALRKRFCRSFNFELQAAATEDAIVLSLGPTHSFALAEVFDYLRSKSVRELLIQALLDAPMFPIRWRWNAGRALAILRWSGGRKVPPRLQRMQAEDLVAVVFPDQLACPENLSGEREVPDHPLVQQTIHDCLTEVMDIEGLEALLSALERGEKTRVARELAEPSPLAHEILNARPYAFLDDAPLEERRTQAVHARRWLDAASAADLGRLDPQAIERVRREAWPQVVSADELHDALVTSGFLTGPEGRADWSGFFAELVAGGRACAFWLPGAPAELWLAAERLPQLLALHPEGRPEPAVVVPRRLAERVFDPDDALAELVQARLEILGPQTPDDLAAPLACAAGAVEIALARLESQGVAMRGRFSPGAGPEEWCDRRLLARIHRATLDRLRREIEPVTPAHYLRFLLAWQHAAADDRLEGPESVAALLEQLEGFEAAAAAWEGEILPARLAEYDPLWLDALCLSGRIVWGRAEATRGGERAQARPIRTTPIALGRRERFEDWRTVAGDGAEVVELTAPARALRDALLRRGASFFDELVRETGLLRTQVEQALAELVASGLATADSFSGLRALLTPSDRRRPLDGRARRSSAVFGMESAGRWSLLPEPAEPPPGPARDDRRLEEVARTLLRRYGVVFRRLLDRESLLPPWRDLLTVLRRLEARGEIRGGRFVDGFSGEQFAMPEAIGRLRALRRAAPSGGLLSISAADPLNLVGILTPGDRVPALAGNRILFRDGEPLALLEAGRVRFLEDLDAEAAWAARNALLRRRVPPQLRAYLGRPA